MGSFYAYLYSDNFLNPPLEDIDINPIIKLIEKTKPDIISLALDPEGSGPETHFKSLQLISSAILSKNSEDISIWGYRNIWHRFSFSEANLFLLVSQEDMDNFSNIFTSCYSTQNNASFPSPLYRGNFSEYATQIQKEQIQNLKILLGESFFKRHHDKKIKNATGLILMKELNVNDLSRFVIKLKKDSDKNSKSSNL